MSLLHTTFSAVISVYGHREWRYSLIAFQFFILIHIYLFAKFYEYTHNTCTCTGRKEIYVFLYIINKIWKKINNSVHLFLLSQQIKYLFPFLHKVIWNTIWEYLSSKWFAVFIWISNFTVKAVINRIFRVQGRIWSKIQSTNELARV